MSRVPLRNSDFSSLIEEGTPRNSTYTLHNARCQGERLSPRKSFRGEAATFTSSLDRLREGPGGGASGTRIRKIGPLLCCANFRLHALTWIVPNKRVLRGSD